MLTVGGLFSGIGGIELGLERAGMRVLWHCEQDPYARAVLERHWPGVPCYEDVCTLSGADVQPVDVLCGGFPCQDLSYAGAGAGLDGARSGLWGEYARLVGELRPRYVVVENVAALLARGLGRVLSDLVALGYDAEWDCIPASAVGAPHRRDRVWLVAYPSSGAGDVGWHSEERRWSDEAEQAGVGCADVAHAEGAGLEGARLPRRPADSGKNVADAANVGYERPRQARDGRLGSQDSSCGGFADWWATEPDVGRVAHGVPARVDRLRCLGNAVVPQIPEWIGRRILEYEGSVT